jgi:hypothetical protein
MKEQKYGTLLIHEMPENNKNEKMPLFDPAKQKEQKKRLVGLLNFLFFGK